MIAKTKGATPRRGALPKAEISSQSAGRTRVRVPEKKRDAAYFESVRKELTKVRGVKQITASPLTGSLLVLHDGEFDGVSENARERGLFDVVDVVPPGTPLSHRVVHRMVGLNQNVKEATEGNYDLSSLAFVGLAGAAVLQILRGEWLPPASSLIGDAIRVLPVNGRLKVLAPTDEAKPTVATIGNA